MGYIESCAPAGAAAMDACLPVDREIRGKHDGSLQFCVGICPDLYYSGAGTDDYESALKSAELKYMRSGEGSFLRKPDKFDCDYGGGKKMLNGFRGSADYVASDDLMNSVNVAMALKKPLLVKGEPGTGKTKLAEAIAASLDMELIIWSIKSTTKAQDGLYVYDTVQRLYDSQRSGKQMWAISPNILSSGKLRGKLFKSGQAGGFTDRRDR